VCLIHFGTWEMAQGNPPNINTIECICSLGCFERGDECTRFFYLIMHIPRNRGSPPRRGETWTLPAIQSSLQWWLTEFLGEYVLLCCLQAVGRRQKASFTLSLRKNAREPSEHVTLLLCTYNMRRTAFIQLRIPATCTSEGDFGL